MNPQLQRQQQCLAISQPFSSRAHHGLALSVLSVAGAEPMLGLRFRCPFSVNHILHAKLVFAYANEQASKWPCVAANIYFACSLMVAVPGEQERVNLCITTAARAPCQRRKPKKTGMCLALK